MVQSLLVICGGMHPSVLTCQLLADLERNAAVQRLPKQVYPRDETVAAVLSAYDIRQSLIAIAPARTLFLAFSAGCLTALSIARYWHHQGGHVGCLIAVDGWGIPMGERFPVHRLSHDYLTHLTSVFPSAEDAHFWAEPAVPHHRLWQAPSQVWGKTSQETTRLTAADFLHQQINRYLPME